MQKLAIFPTALRRFFIPTLRPVANGFGTLLIVFAERLKSLFTGMQTMKRFFMIRKTFNDQKKSRVKNRHGCPDPFAENGNAVSSPEERLILF